MTFAPTPFKMSKKKLFEEHKNKSPRFHEYQRCSVAEEQRDLHRQIQHTPLLEESELVATC
jgi:hypothetical protein